MSEVSVKAKKSNAADLTMTKEYLVIKGNHYQASNGYLYRVKQTQAVSVKEILNMEYLTMRSKRLFIIFIILMTIVVFGGVGVRKMLAVTKQIDKEVQKVENVYNYVADKDIDINVTGTVKSVFSEIGIVGIVVIYIVLIVCSVICFLRYLLIPFRVLYISTIGKIIAVERKFYEKSQLDAIINIWKTQLT